MLGYRIVRICFAGQLLAPVSCWADFVLSNDSLISVFGRTVGGQSDGQRWRFFNNGCSKLIRLLQMNCNYWQF